MYLSVPVKNEEKELSSLDDCFLNYFKEEKFDKNHRLTCEGCKKLGTFKKQIIITKPPHILIVHLKRFAFENNSMFKLNHMIDYPLQNLDISKYIFDNTQTVYDLFAVACHRGNMNFGHYYSAAFDNADGKWVLFDDNKNKVVENKKIGYLVKSYEAYLLFYIKRDLQWFRRQTLRNYV